MSRDVLKPDEMCGISFAGAQFVTWFSLSMNLMYMFSILSARRSLSNRYKEIGKRLPGWRRQTTFPGLYLDSKY